MAIENYLKPCNAHDTDKSISIIGNGFEKEFLSDLSKKGKGKVTKMIRKLDKYSMTEEKLAERNKAQVLLYKTGLKIRHALIGGMHVSLQKKVSDYRQKLGINETPHDYTKASVIGSYMTAPLKVAMGVGLIKTINIPVLSYLPLVGSLFGKAGISLLGWAAYTSFLESPVRTHLMKKGKPRGVLFWEAVDYAAKKAKKKIKQKKPDEIIVSDKLLEEIVVPSNGSGKNDAITETSRADSPSQLS